MRENILATTRFQVYRGCGEGAARQGGTAPRRGCGSGGGCPPSGALEYTDGISSRLETDFAVFFFDSAGYIQSLLSVPVLHRRVLPVL